MTIAMRSISGPVRVITVRLECLADALSLKAELPRWRCMGSDASSCLPVAMGRPQPRYAEACNFRYAQCASAGCAWELIKSQAPAKHRTAATRKRHKIKLIRLVSLV